MSLSRKRPATVPDLSVETVAILLHGWGATPPEPSIPNPGFAGGFYELATGGAAELWRENEAYLRSVAARWRWQPSTPGPDGQMIYYGEAKALGVRVAGER